MQTQGLTSRFGSSSTSTFGDPARRLALSGLIVGVAIGAWSAWGLERIVPAAMDSGAQAVLASRAAVPALEPDARVTGAGRSLSIAIPADGAYVTTSSIPVAGTAYGRPHGPAVKSVHVELIVQGRSITTADFPVFSGRFAGVLGAPGLDARTDATLRVTDPLHARATAAAQDLTIAPR